MAKHTPGPWDEKGGIVYSPGARGVVCQLSEPYAIDYVEHWPLSLGSPARDEIAANAALIAAAPDLLALVETVEWVDLRADTCPWCGEWKIHGHASGCPRQRALERARGQREEGED